MIAGLLLATSPAFADGFVCESKSESLVVRVYNHVDPENGTKNAAIMILSDSSIQFGKKTIATFGSSDLTLENQGTIYTGKVDHRFSASGRKGELIGGTNIGALKSIVLNVDFDYSRPVANGTILRGDLTLNKRNGDQIEIPMSCARYLKK